MKLAFCPECGDVFCLRTGKESRFCECSSSWGRYINNREAVVGGLAIPFGIGNGTFERAMKEEQFTFEGFFYSPYGWCETKDVTHEDDKVAYAAFKVFKEHAKNKAYQNGLMSEHTRNYIYNKVIDEVPRVQDAVIDLDWFKNWLWKMLCHITKEKNETHQNN